MRTGTLAHLAIAALGCSALAAPISRAVAAEPVDAALEGTWLVTAAEQGGKTFDAIKGGTLAITGDRFRLQTATGNQLAGKLRTRNDVSPWQLDFLLDGGAIWQAIYTVNGPVFRLVYVEDGAPRPTVFATTADLPGTAIVMRKSEVH